MATYNVSDDALNSEAARQYFTRADRRIVIGLRYALEMLKLPVPEYAHRRERGPSPARAVLTAYRADNPETRATTLAPRKPNASAETVAAARAERP